MGNFEDRLIGELMDEHGPALAVLERPGPRRRSNRPLWLTAGALMVALAAAGVLTLATGGGSPAYAVTQNPNGTVTLTLTDLTGVDGANAELRKLGLPVLVLPFADFACRGGFVHNDAITTMTVGGIAGITDEQVTFSLSAIPAGDSLVVAARKITTGPSSGKVEQIAFMTGLAKGRPPVCGPLSGH